MPEIRSAALVMRVIAMFAVAFVGAAPAGAEDQGESVIDGRCQYPQKVARFRAETTLLLCDTVTIGRGTPTATLDFMQRSWGSMGQFAGAMPGDKMTVSQVTLRDGRTVAATGSCEIFRDKDGRLSTISCLAKAGPRPVAANFVASRI